MIRLQKDQATPLLMVLSWAEMSNVSMADVEYAMAAWAPRSHDVLDTKLWKAITAEWVRDSAYVKKEDKQAVIVKLRQFLTKAIYQSGGEMHDGDLINQVVNLLTAPYSRNLISGRTIERLRQAVLLPEESAKLRNEVLTREMSCAGCGRQFESGEIATFMYDGQGSGGPTFYCSRCEPPCSDKCVTCGSTKRMHTRLSAAIKKSAACETCQAAAAKGQPVTRIEPTPVAQGPIGEPARPADRYVELEGGRRGGRAGVGQINTGRWPMAQPAPDRAVTADLAATIRLNPNGGAPTPNTPTAAAPTNEVPRETRGEFMWRTAAVPDGERDAPPAVIPAVTFNQGAVDAEQTRFGRLWRSLNERTLTQAIEPTPTPTQDRPDTRLPEVYRPRTFEQLEALVRAAENVAFFNVGTQADPAGAVAAAPRGEVEGFRVIQEDVRAATDANEAGHETR